MSDKKENMMYICGKCAHEVERDAKVCPYCHANLNNIRCPYCGYVGAPEKFKNNHCPLICISSLSNFLELGGV